MKNQFFADKRDFFKYDLLLEILEGVPTIRQLSFVPMLTPNDIRNDGKFTRYGADGRRVALHRFLQDCVDKESRDIQLLRHYFADVAHIYYPYRDSTYFTHDGREEYFLSLPSSALRQAVVFLDPDNGMEVKSTRRGNGDKYLRYDELSSIVQRMDSESIAVVYQHLPHRKREAFFREISEKLSSLVRVEDVMWISDNQIAFFVVPHPKGAASEVRRLVERYAYRMDLSFGTHTTSIASPKL